MLYFIAVEPLYDEGSMRIVYLSCLILMRAKGDLRETMENMVF